MDEQADGRTGGPVDRRTFILGQKRDYQIINKTLSILEPLSILASSIIPHPLPGGLFFLFVT